ncbi:MAG TPA: pyridoxamine 5'-phosphate oxidase family protein [Vicinamibacteria bacterium]|nr:pyridoxamine 5'-phosphate oxidase family protein [Vicinamibacteria bacterium]
MSPTPRSTVRRLPDRARYDRETVDAILDEGLVCHVGFVDAGQPFVIPSAYARAGDRLILHGSAASRMVKALAGGVPACVTVTLLDGLVLARSGFHHSMNYRSVVVLGKASEITDPGEKRRALDAIVEHVAPGRVASVRPPSENELRATRVVALPLDEASAKVRTGPPKDDEADYGLPVWAGELPLRLEPLEPVADPHPGPAVALPPHVTGWRRPRR